MPDVVVVGAGTAGCFTSYLLAKKGLDVVLLDKGSGVKDKIICTGVISREAFERFSLPPESILREISAFKIFAASGECFHYAHAEPFANVINREFFHDWLFKRALDEGVQFMPGCKVRDMQFGPEGVKALFDCRKTFDEISAKMLVLATGADFSLLEKAGLKGPSSYIQGVQAEAEIKGMDDVEILLGQDVAPKSFAWCVPLKQNRAKIGLTTERNSAVYLVKLLKNPLLKGKVEMPSSKARFRYIPYGMAEKSCSDRVLAVGDAAGQVKTTTGGGIYYGLIGSELAAETIYGAFSRDEFSERYLRQYEKRWHKALKPEIHAGLTMRKFYASLNDDKINLAINLANNDGIRPLILKKAKFDWQKDFLFSLLKRPIVRNLF